MNTYLLKEILQHMHLWYIDLQIQQSVIHIF